MAKDEKKKTDGKDNLKKSPATSKETPKTIVQKKEEPKKQEKKKEKIEASDAKTVSDAFDVIKFVLMTEKSVRMVETQNKLVFIVNRSAARDEIKKAVQNAFNSPVMDVKTVIDQAGRKKAFVKFANEGAAGDIAIKLGII